MSRYERWSRLALAYVALLVGAVLGPQVVGWSRPAVAVLLVGLIVFAVLPWIREDQWWRDIDRAKARHPMSYEVPEACPTCGSHGALIRNMVVYGSEPYVLCPDGWHASLAHDEMVDRMRADERRGWLDQGNH